MQAEDRNKYVMKRERGPRKGRNTGSGDSKTRGTYIW
jgi:hypothetical protein